MTGVKEQVAGQYEERIARAGYVTLVLDHRHFAESEGIPLYMRGSNLLGPIY